MAMSFISRPNGGSREAKSGARILPSVRGNRMMRAVRLANFSGFADLLAGRIDFRDRFAITVSGGLEDRGLRR